MRADEFVRLCAELEVGLGRFLPALPSQVPSRPPDLERAVDAQAADIRA